MPESDFDIYQTDRGYTAVTNDVRRQILAALAKKDRGLPDLMKITGKAKPTLSSVHMKELLNQHLIEELPHATDSRKKVYRLKARRIGSSNVPVDQLRSAVKQYVTLSPLTARLALPAMLEAIAAAPASTSRTVLAAQARRLGELAAHLLTPHEGRDLVSTLAGFLEQEGLARPLRLDLEHAGLEAEFMIDLAPEDAATFAMLTAAVVEGALATRREKETVRVAGEALETPRRFRLVVRTGAS